MPQLRCTTMHLKPAGSQKNWHSRKIDVMADRKESTAALTGRCRTRSRKIIWFNPPFCKSVRTNIGRKFLGLVNKHFQKGGPLSNIFNRSMLKVSFSCMSYVAAIIKSHNGKILHAAAATGPTGPLDEPRRLCNCRKPLACTFACNY